MNPSEPKILWHNPETWGFEGKGWKDTERLYDRLPAKAKALVPEVVWQLSRSATGIAIFFETNAPWVQVRWRLHNHQLGEPNFPAAGFSGVDLYCHDGKKYEWVGAGHLVASQNPDLRLIDGMDTSSKKFLLYLPMRNPVESVEIGIPEGSAFKPVPPRKEKPVVFYGTSIVHGAYVSHAGMVHTSILGRRLHVPVMNLGFSGNARMETSLADLLAELDASVYVIDPLPNMDLALVKERAEVFIRRLCAAKPKTPIVLVEDRPYNNLWIRPAAMKAQEEKWAFYFELFQRLKQEAVGNLRYVPGRHLFGQDREASPDSSHPTDLGNVRMADVLEPVLREALAG